MTLLQRSLAGGLMIAVVLMVRALAAERLPRRAFLILWEIALLRLLLPWAAQSPFSLYALVRPAPTARGGAAVWAARLIPSSAASGQAAEAPAGTPWWRLLWIVGCLVCILYFGVASLRWRRRFAESLPVEDGWARGWIKIQGLKRRVRLRQSDRVGTPLTYGLLRPVILVPASMEWDDREQASYILCHELTHIRRWDLLTKLLLAAALCIHWFNPLVWGMFLLANRDLELSCDEAVVRAFGEGSRAGYSMALLRQAERNSRPTPLCSGFGKSAIEERVEAIVKYRKTHFTATLCAALLVAAVALGLATTADPHRGAAGDRAPSTPDAGSAAALFQGDGALGQTPAVAFEHVELRYYEDNGWPYLHDAFTNRTGRTIRKLEYGMLAYDAEGAPLQIVWQMLDSSAEAAYDCLAEVEAELPSGQTADQPGGWSLYDEEKMPGWPRIGGGGPNRVAYALYCVRRIVFEDGTVWENSDYDDWLDTYRGRTVKPALLQSYYPYTQILTEA